MLEPFQFADEPFGNEERLIRTKSNHIQAETKRHARPQERRPPRPLLQLKQSDAGPNTGSDQEQRYREQEQNSERIDLVQVLTARAGISIHDAKEKASPDI